MTTELTQALKSIQGFSSVEEKILDQLAAFASMRIIRAGETIFCQGEPSPYCFGVLSGEVVIQHVSKDRRFPPKVLGVVSQGHLFGESAVFEDSARQAMASASRDGKLVAVRGLQLREWITQNPALSQPLLLALLKASGVRLHRTSHELAVIYGVGRLLGSQKISAEQLSATLEFIKGSMEGLDDIVLYQRSAYWEEFSPVLSLPVLQDILPIPLDNEFLKIVSSTQEAHTCSPESVKPQLTALALPWEARAAIALIPLFNWDKTDKPLEGLLCLASQQKKEAFSTEKRLLLTSAAQLLSEALARHVRQDEAEAQSRLQKTKRYTL